MQIAADKAIAGQSDKAAGTQAIAILSANRLTQKAAKRKAKMLRSWPLTLSPRSKTVLVIRFLENKKRSFGEEFVETGDSCQASEISPDSVTLTAKTDLLEMELTVWHGSQHSPESRNAHLIEEFFPVLPVHVRVRTPLSCFTIIPVARGL